MKIEPNSDILCQQCQSVIYVSGGRTRIIQIYIFYYSCETLKNTEDAFGVSLVCFESIYKIIHNEMEPSVEKRIETFIL